VNRRSTSAVFRRRFSSIREFVRARRFVEYICIADLSSCAGSSGHDRLLLPRRRAGTLEVRDGSSRGTGPRKPLIMGFIDTMRSEGPRGRVDLLLADSLCFVSIAGLRRQRRRPRTTLVDTADLQAVPRCPGSAIEDRDQLEKAIQQLSPTQRAVIAMTFYLDMTPREIGLEINRSKSAVRAHLSKGLARPRGSWSPESAAELTTSTGELRHDT